MMAAALCACEPGSMDGYHTSSPAGAAIIGAVALGARVVKGEPATDPCEIDSANMWSSELVERRSLGELAQVMDRSKVRLRAFLSVHEEDRENDALVTSMDPGAPGFVSVPIDDRFPNSCEGREVEVEAVVYKDGARPRLALQRVRFAMSNRAQTPK